MPRIAALIVMLTLSLAALTLGAPAKPPATAPANKFTVTGRLTTGMMAIGGETTGIVINAGTISYELDIKDAALKRTANDLNGKQVTVTGTLTIRQGVEIAQRRIIVVDTLQAAAPVTQPK